MVNVYNLILAEAERRKISYVRKFFPFYIASLGCHVFNIMNQGKQIYVEGGTVPNTRLHLLFVAFPGFGKSFFLKQWLKGHNSLLEGTSVPVTFEGSQTDAGFIGTAHFNEQGKPEIKEGLCKQEKSSIVGIEEFSAITNSFKQTYNVGLDTSLLTSLDSGDVVKRLGAGRVSYHTDLTLWAGVQPARYDLSSGFSRRFAFLAYYPTLRDIQRYRESRRAMKGIGVSESHIKSLKLAIDQRVGEIHKFVKRVYFGQDFYRELNKMDIMHYEDELYERIGLGYTLMSQDRLEDTVEVRLTPELKRIIQLEYEMKNEVKKTSDTSIIWNLIRDEKKVREWRVENISMSLGMELGNIKTSVNNLIIYKKIKREGRDIIIL